MSTKAKKALAEELAGPLLTRDDVAALLVAYYGAVKLDNVRVNQLRREGRLLRKYDREHWKEHRERHLLHIRLLLDTLSLVSPEILANLTVLAATQKPTMVREVLVRLLAEGVWAYLVGERMWSAPEFFNALVKEIDIGTRTRRDRVDTVKRMMRWLDPGDPLLMLRSVDMRPSNLERAPDLYALLPLRQSDRLTKGQGAGILRPALCRLDR